MRKIAIFTIFIGSFLLCLTPIAAQQPAVTKKSGSLSDVVGKASKNQFKKDSDLFRVPTTGQLKAWNFIVESIFKDRLGDANQMIKQLSFPYELSLFTDNATKREYVLLEEKVPLQAGWGLYVFDAKTKSSLIVEIPHPVADSNTEFQGIDAFQQTEARAYLLAGANRRASKTASPCTQPKSAEAETYPMSDVAHAVGTPFHAVHETLVRLMPTTVVVQLHGMGERENCKNAFISNGTRTVTANSKRVLSCLEKNGVEAEIYDGKTSCPLTALTNVQGRFSNGETSEPCDKNAKSSPEPGSFIHIEQEPNLRRDKSSWQPVVDALKCAFPVETGPTPRQSFVFQSLENPDVTVFFAFPPKASSKTKFLMVMAGRQRNADEYLDSWTEWAAANDYLVVAPQFDDKNWPEPLGYNFGNIASGKEAANTPNPKSKWAFTVIEQIFDHVRAKYKLNDNKYDLFGHSAGGQFVHRFMLFYPEHHVRLAIAANPGFYTLPDASAKFPYGLMKSPIPITQKNIDLWTQREVVIMRGTADIERTENLRQTPEADAQGKNRFERAAFMFGEIKRVNPDSTWRLIDVPGVAHDQKGMAVAAQKVFQSTR